MSFEEIYSVSFIDPLQTPLLWNIKLVEKLFYKLRSVSNVVHEVG